MTRFWKIALLLHLLLTFTCVTTPPIHAQNRKPIREMREAAKPGPNHAKLDPFIGEWKIRIQYRVKPDAPPEMAVGKAEFRWILGKRFLEQTIDGKGIAGALEGRGVIGFDNTLKQYTGTWISTMSSGITRMTGKVDAKGTTFEFAANATDPIAKKEIKVTAVFQLLGPDHIQYSFFVPHPENGKPVNMLQISYHRKR